MAGIQWIKRGGRHRDVRGREAEQAAREEIEDALPSPASKRAAKPGERSRAKRSGRIRLEFTTPLTRVGPKGAWTGLFLTREQSERLGTRGRVPVVGSLNGHPIRSFLAPMGDGTHGMMVNKAMQVGAKAKPGQHVRVMLEVDDAPRTVEVPSDLKRALARAPEAASAFDRLSCTHRKDYVTWIDGAKRPETRARRVAETLRLLAEAKQWKDR